MDYEAQLEFEVMLENMENEARTQHEHDMMLFGANGVAAGGPTDQPAKAAATAMDEEAIVPRSEAVVESEAAKAAASPVGKATVPRSEALRCPIG